MLLEVLGLKKEQITVPAFKYNLICEAQGDEEVTEVQPALEDQVKVVLLRLVARLDREQRQGVLQSTVDVSDTRV